MVVPLGVGQIHFDKRGRGMAYAVSELALAGLATYSYARMVRLAEAGQVDEELTWRMVSAISTGAFAGVYTAQVIDGARLWQLHAEGVDDLALSPGAGWLPRDQAVARFVAIPGA